MKIDDKPASEMTLRERAAIAALQGFCSAVGSFRTFADDAHDAVAAADALCRELAKPRPKPAWQPMRTAPDRRWVEVCFRGCGDAFVAKKDHGRWQSPDGRVLEAYDMLAWREIETDDNPEQLPTEPLP